MNKLYIGLDGDSIGRVIEEYLITNQVQKMKEFSNLIISALEQIREQAIALGGEVIFCSGDSILVSGDFDQSFAEFARTRFQEITQRSASVGVGYSTANTYLGLKLAKSRGGNQVVFYDLQEQEK